MDALSLAAPPAPARKASPPRPSPPHLGSPPPHLGSPAHLRSLVVLQLQGLRLRFSLALTLALTLTLTLTRLGAGAGTPGAVVLGGWGQDEEGLAPTNPLTLTLTL